MDFALLRPGDACPVCDVKYGQAFLSTMILRVDAYMCRIECAIPGVERRRHRAPEIVDSLAAAIRRGAIPDGTLGLWIRTDAVFDVEETPATPVIIPNPATHYPDKCYHCGGPAYIGISVDCMRRCPGSQAHH